MRRRTEGTPPLVRAAAAGRARRRGPRRLPATPRVAERRDRGPPAAPAPGGRRRHVDGCRGPGRLGSGLTPEGILEAVRSWLDDDRPGAMGRIGRAIVGWAPIALGIGWVAGEISGCGRFAAGCDDAEVMSAWLVQIAALVALLVVGASPGSPRSPRWRHSPPRSLPRSCCRPREARTTRRRAGSP